MLTELNEADATGDIARIYADVRRTCAVPYVSALYRHLATRPGVLPWAWAAVSPALENGTAQGAGWRVAADLPIDPLPSIPRDALRVWAIDASAEQVVRNVCDGFVRVAPVNMVFAALLKRFIAGETPNGKSASATWQPPADIRAARRAHAICNNERWQAVRSWPLPHAGALAGTSRPPVGGDGTAARERNDSRRVRPRARPHRCGGP
jgi:hypothetical protein